MYGDSLSSYELSNRCRTLENEIALQRKFNKELYPAPPKRLKKTRWNFDLLNQENQQIQQMARRAFDPANSFIPITSSSQNYDNLYSDDYTNYYQSKMKLPISTPHRVADPTVFYKKRQMLMQQKEEDEREREKAKLYERLERRRNLTVEHVDYNKKPSRYNSTQNSYINDDSRYRQRKKYYSEALSPKSKSSASDMDSTIDQFVDKIDDYKKW